MFGSEIFLPFCASFNSFINSICLRSISLKTPISFKESKIILLRQIKQDLTNSASTIRTKATQIYNEQKAAEEERLKAEEENKQNN